MILLLLLAIIKDSPGIALPLLNALISGTFKSCAPDRIRLHFLAGRHHNLGLECILLPRWPVVECDKAKSEFAVWARRDIRPLLFPGSYNWHRTIRRTSQQRAC